MTAIISVLTWVVVCICVFSLGSLMAIQFWPYSQFALFMERVTYRQPANLSLLNRRKWLSRVEFAQLEKDIPHLKSVVFVGSRMDQPTPQLTHAVIDNFSEGVRYSFFVSQAGNSDDDLTAYRSWFSHMYGAAMASWNSELPAPKFDEIFVLKRLPIDWSYAPYIFYGFNGGEVERVLALKGSESGVGLARAYTVVAQPEARTIIELVSATSTNIMSELNANDPIVSSIPTGQTRKLVLVQNP